VKAGFGRIVLVNGHGGNMAALSAVATDISSRTGQRIFTTTYFIEAEQEIASILEEQSNLQHACEGETSMMWALSPDHVRPSALCDGPDFELSHVLQPSLRAFEPFSRITQNGVSGAATNADAKKGERLLAAAAHALTRCLATQCHQDALIAS
jgi:creatinine amidohydrolase